MLTKGLLAAAAAATAALIALVAIPLEPRGELESLVAERLADSGVEHGITAVLLNFRSFDTLLEIGVLLLAVMAARALPGISVDAGRPTSSAPANTPLVQWMLPRMLIVAVMVAGYLIWAGAVRWGGAFQGGTVLAAAGILLLLGRAILRLPSGPGWRFALAIGLIGFVAFGIGSWLSGWGVFVYPSLGAGLLVLAIELGMMISIGACFLHLVGVVHDRGGEGR